MYIVDSKGKTLYIPYIFMYIVHSKGLITPLESIS